MLDTDKEEVCMHSHIHTHACTHRLTYTYAVIHAMKKREQDRPGNDDDESLWCDRGYLLWWSGIWIEYCSSEPSKKDLGEHLREWKQHFRSSKTETSFTCLRTAKKIEMFKAHGAQAVHKVDDIIMVGRENKDLQIWGEFWLPSI